MAIKKPFVFRTQVRFSQTDPAGYVFYPRFFELFQAAVEDWFYEGLELSYAERFKTGWALPTAHTECDFISPCRLGDQFELTLYPEKIGNSSITLRFIGRVNGRECLRARQVLVVINTQQDGRPQRIDDDLRARLHWYLDTDTADTEPEPA